MISNEGREFCRGIGLLAEHIICMADSYEEPIEKFKKSPFYSPEFEDKGRIIQDNIETANRIRDEVKLISINDLTELHDTYGIALVEYADLQEKVFGLLSEGGGADYEHSLSNMALLNAGDNAALNNSTFDVKRNIIVEMDRGGHYIPLCTKKVFLKYYTESEDNQIHFWGEADRKAYIAEMNRVLKPYLDNEIVIGKEQI